MKRRVSCQTVSICKIQRKVMKSKWLDEPYKKEAALADDFFKTNHRSFPFLRLEISWCVYPVGMKDIDVITDSDLVRAVVIGRKLVEPGIVRIADVQVFSDVDLGHQGETVFGSIGDAQPHDFVDEQGHTQVGLDRGVLYIFDQYGGAEIEVLVDRDHYPRHGVKVSHKFGK